MPTIVLALVCAAALPASAQPKGKKGDPASQPAKIDPKAEAKPDVDKGGDKTKKGTVKNFDFSGLDLNGRMRTPQLLYFLERANEELERASLEKRSFIPHMVRTVEEETL